jgi:mxaJ protein
MRKTLTSRSGAVGRGCGEAGAAPPGASRAGRPGGVRLCLLPLLLLAACGGPPVEGVRAFRVCADPNNLPFSNERGEGFENRIVELIARELDAELTYTWWAQRRGFIRNTLRADECDLVPGIPSSFELAQPTRPYYRSTYVFVYPKDAGYRIGSFDDPILRELRIGVHVIGDDYTNTPPAHALAARGMIDNVVGYAIYGDYSEENPPARLVEGVAKGEIDVAIAWGPLAGFFAKRLPIEVELVPVSPEIDLPFLPMIFDISMGVRREDVELRREIEEILERRRPEIDAILAEYGVPRAERPRVRGGM